MGTEGTAQISRDLREIIPVTILFSPSFIPREKKKLGGNLHFRQSCINLVIYVIFALWAKCVYLHNQIYRRRFNE